MRNVRHMQVRAYVQGGRASSRLRRPRWRPTSVCRAFLHGEGERDTASRREYATRMSTTRITRPAADKRVEAARLRAFLMLHVQIVVNKPGEHTVDSLA